LETTCLVVQHAAPECAFTIADALQAAGVNVDTRRVFEGDDLPETATGLDGLVVMGGSMAAYSDEGFPSRNDELTLLADAIRTGKPTLGVCLGAQLVAVAAGGSAYRGTSGGEIGWLGVTATEEVREDALFAGVPQELTVLQWHNDTFDLPPGAALLMNSPNYPNQAFRMGDVVWGLQFHLEVDVPALEGFLDAFASELHDVPNEPEQMRRDAPSAVHALGPWRDLVFGRFARLVADRAACIDLVTSRTGLIEP
jgi:GMP synthase-like glutamine amidotransferase